MEEAQAEVSLLDKNQDGTAFTSLVAALLQGKFSAAKTPRSLETPKMLGSIWTFVLSGYNIEC